MDIIDFSTNSMSHYDYQNINARSILQSDYIGLNRTLQTFQNQQSMEEVRTADSNGSPVSDSREKLFPSHKKNSLKFCRRVSKMLIDQVSAKPSNSSSLIAKFVEFLESLLEKQIDMFSSTITDITAFKNSHLDFIKKIWERNREILSEKKNNKLSLVNFEEWETIFSFKGFDSHLHQLKSSINALFSNINLHDKADQSAFLTIYSKLLYILNNLILNYIIFVDIFMDREIHDIIPEFENFVLMTIEPWIYKHYNHTKAKFARECCSSCKICRSSLLPSNFVERLDAARSRYYSIKKIFQIRPSDSITEQSNVDSTIFSFIAYDIWM